MWDGCLSLFIHFGGDVMATLYELTGAYLKLQEMLYDEEMDPEAVLDTLESIDGDLEDKADGYARIIRQIAADAEALGNEIDRLTKRKRSLDRKAEMLTKILKKSMETTGKVKFKTALFSFSIVNNPAALVIDDPKMIPGDFLIQQDPKIDKWGITKAIKEGVDFSGIAHMERSTRLSIK